MFGIVMPENHSVTVWFQQLEQGDSEAARKLFRRYFTDLVAVARRRLKDAPRRVADEEDVAARAFESFFLGAQAREFPDLRDRQGLGGIPALGDDVVPPLPGIDVLRLDVPRRSLHDLRSSVRPDRR